MSGRREGEVGLAHLLDLAGDSQEVGHPFALDAFLSVHLDSQHLRMVNKD
jgi:hypothetical protein